MLWVCRGTCTIGMDWNEGRYAIQYIVARWMTEQLPFEIIGGTWFPTNPYERPIERWEELTERPREQTMEAQIKREGNTLGHETSTRFLKSLHVTGTRNPPSSAPLRKCSISIFRLYYVFKWPSFLTAFDLPSILPQLME